MFSSVAISHVEILVLQFQKLQLFPKNVWYFAHRVEVTDERKSIAGGCPVSTRIYCDTKCQQPSLNILNCVQRQTVHTNAFDNRCNPKWTKKQTREKAPMSSRSIRRLTNSRCPTQPQAAQSRTLRNGVFCSKLPNVWENAFLPQCRHQSTSFRCHVHTSYLSFFLHGQNFWKIKFTPKFPQ